MPHVGKDKTANTGSYSYRYADLADIAQVLMPILAAEGLAWTARPTLDGDRFVLAYSLIHGASGEREDGAYPLPDPSRATPQQVGSAITYGRRYCLTAVTGLVVGGEDDDGQAANHAPAAPPDPRTVARAELWQAAKAKGYRSPADLVAAFAVWSQGEVLNEAAPEMLREFQGALPAPDSTEAA